jgi:gluconate 5-dehydrogenase
MGPKLFDLTGRHALVTGASRGIGFALARGLAASGAAVALNGRDADALAACREGAAVFEAPFDVTDRAQVEAGVALIEAEFGPIDILVNNAGMQRRGPLEDFTDQDWRDLMRLNLDAVFMVGQTVARRMIPRGQGKIINICSAMTALARATVVPYTTAKGAVGRADYRAGLGPGFQRLARAAHAAGPLGPGRGAGGCRGLPRLGCRQLRQRAYPLRRWRAYGNGLT